MEKQNCKICTYFEEDSSVGFYDCACDAEDATDEIIDINWEENGINCPFYKISKKTLEEMKCEEKYGYEK
ncbi:MAG: hypothetical protein K0R54_579 [Clostridiaceae bacterium]|jgi:hypothetical protein|nr:hypothetical protein [Clostridiaceae bacterium]